MPLATPSGRTDPSTHPQKIAVSAVRAGGAVGALSALSARGVRALEWRRKRGKKCVRGELHLSILIQRYRLNDVTKITQDHTGISLSKPAKIKGSK